jgi:hypothetical protein
MAEYPSQNLPSGKNKNNPTKEIFASSGIYDEIAYAQQPYASDIPNSVTANAGINTTTTSTTSTTTTIGPESSGLLPLSSFVPFIHDILIFNNYIHYDTKGSLKTINPLSLIS